MSEVGMTVRISAATPEADLAAAVWPGVTTITYPRVESARQIEQVDAVIARLERLRGIRPGHVRLHALIESSRGVSLAAEIAAGSHRVEALGVGTGITLELEGDSLLYARAACELHARARGIAPLDPFSAHD